MGNKNLVMLKTDIDSISIVHGNMLWALASLRVFFCKYVLSSFLLILRYIFRREVEERKIEHAVSPALADQTKQNQFEDSEIDGFAEKLVNLVFPSIVDFHVAGEEREEETQCSVLVEATVCDVPRDRKNAGAAKTESSVLVETDSDFQEDGKENERDADCSALKEKYPNIHGGCEESEGEKEGSDFPETVSYVHGDVKKINESETDCSVFMQGDSNVYQYGRKTEEEETEGSMFMYSHPPTTTSKYQFTSRKDVSVFTEEPTTLTFSFRDFYAGPNVSAGSSDNAFANPRNIDNKEFSEGIVAQEEEEYVQEQRTSTSNSFAGDYLLDSENSLPSSSSGLTWGNSNNNDARVTCQILRPNNSCEEGLESESLKVNKEGGAEDVEETQVSCNRKVSHGLAGEDTEKEGSYHEEETIREENLDESDSTMWEENLDESDSEEEDDDDDLDWEDDDDELVEQLKMELRIAKQGGLATILEEDEEETESPKVVEDLKPLKIEEKVEYKDHMVQIQKVYKSYAEKMRKLDVLNDQTMHAIGLLQLKDPPKLFLMPKSTVQSAKPLISQNLWPRKASKHTSDPMVKFVHELHRDLELVYVGQVCLSWEILCWQQKKAKELQQHDSKWPHRYNLVAGEFQLFQVLMQRLIENEPFQGPRIQNYVKNRCIVRNLLHVPAIKDDNRKDKKITKWGEEEDAISSVRLVEIIKESMQVFWEFVRADKDYGNVIPKVSKKKIGNDVSDPEIQDLLVDIRAQLQKKERKLKDIVRSGSCIVRKFQKHNEDKIQLDHEQLLAQVGLRLISRVVNMKRLRKDQLVWCSEKLNRIKFVGRKIQVEPSFLLFPC